MNKEWQTSVRRQTKVKLIWEDTHASPHLKKKVGKSYNTTTKLRLCVEFEEIDCLLKLLQSKYKQNSTFSTTNNRISDIMKTFQIVTLFALIAAAMAFAPNSVPQGELLLWRLWLPSKWDADGQLNHNSVNRWIFMLMVQGNQSFSLWWSISRNPGVSKCSTWQPRCDLEYLNYPLFALVRPQHCWIKQN